MIETVEITMADLERCLRQRLRFEVGRAKINARRHAALATATAAVRTEYDRDLIAKHPPRGRILRIARRLHMTRQTVGRIVGELLKCPP
jgi:hypothetical protein